MIIFLVTVGLIGLALTVSGIMAMRRREAEQRALEAEDRLRIIMSRYESERSAKISPKVEYIGSRRGGKVASLRQQEPSPQDDGFTPLLVTSMLDGGYNAPSAPVDSAPSLFDSGRSGGGGAVGGWDSGGSSYSDSGSCSSDSGSSGDSGGGSCGGGD